MKQDCTDDIFESGANIRRHLWCVNSNGEQVLRPSDCNYFDSNTGSDCSNFSNVTFEFRCYYNVAIFEDRDFILSNYTFGSWFLVRVPESRCDLNDDTCEDRCTSSVDNFRVCHCTDGHQEHIVSTSWPKGVQDTR